MKKVFFLFFLISGISFSQNLEEDIYNAAETFMSNKNENSFQILNKHEATFKNQAKTKDEHLALVFLQCNKGYYLDEQSKLKEAISAYEDALKRFNNNHLSKISDFDIIENCLKPLGNLYTKTGDYTNALSTINQYIFLAEKTRNTKQQISGAINIAKLYQTIGKHETVLKIIENANKLSQITNSQKELLLGIKTTSLVALKRFNEASIINNSASVSKFESYKNDYYLELQKGNYFEALNYFEKAKKNSSEVNLSSRELAKLYVEEAQLHYLLKNLKDAIKSLNVAVKILIPKYNIKELPHFKDLIPENTLIDIFDLFASIETDSKKALQYYDLSFSVSDLLEASWTSQETKIHNETSNRLRSEKCIDILFNTFQQTKNKSLLFEAFQYSDNNKVSVLRDMNQKKMLLKKHPKDSLLIQEFQLLKNQEYYTNLYIKEQLGANQSSKINDLSKKLSAISLQLKTLKAAVSKKYPISNSMYSLESLQAKLSKDNAVLVSYFYGKKTIYQFIISKNNIELNNIVLDTNSTLTITNFIHLFDNATIINNDISNYTNQAFKVFELLKFNKLSNFNNIVIVPDGLLNFIPFEAMLTSNTKSTSFSNMPFVVKAQNIAYNSSAFFYINSSMKPYNKKVLGIFPVFENTNQKLTYSIDEANAIKKEMPSTMFMNEKATKANFIKNASNFDVLHLSTHASSGNFINPSSISFYGETMNLNELYSLNMNPNLVVLSACETGIGKLYKGEGAMSIARGFQYAGAENLLFSLWQINDLSTSQIMESFYKNYNALESVFYANHQSKIGYLENEDISNTKKSPYYWSAFVYYGSIEPIKSNNTLLYLIFSLIIGVIVLFLFLKLNKHGRNTSRISS